MSFENVQKYPHGLREFAEQAEGSGQDAGDFKVRKAQPHAVQKTIRQLERRTIPVPEGLKSEKLSRATALGQQEKHSGKNPVHEERLEIVEHLGRACGLRPHDQLQALHTGQSHNNTTERVAYGNSNMLTEMGGSGKEREVLAKMDLQLKGKFT